jgi:hypothetical protein
MPQSAMDLTQAEGVEIRERPVLGWKAPNGTQSR